MQGKVEDKKLFEQGVGCGLVRVLFISGWEMRMFQEKYFPAETFFGSFFVWVTKKELDPMGRVETGTVGRYNEI